MTKKNSVRLLVLDVLKPHEPSIVEYAETLADIEGIAGVNISVLEVDSKTETIEVFIEGERIVITSVFETIKNLGGTVHSIDKVAAGRKLVHEISTHQSLKKL